MQNGVFKPKKCGILDTMHSAATANKRDGDGLNVLAVINHERFNNHFSSEM